ncbi:MAG: hypothetical protein RMK91_05980 [Pseudanabaenaceae cyanobacterium SKYGB_i_bin29]|nr:hypothetical protein [Pseudanabaenaceae cyanobacterium SKYG29]MDW8421400.1 hypothetical protein [Pseudanabaenaceae cyanobacterium SKYGB_i_bin29]
MWDFSLPVIALILGMLVAIISPWLFLLQFHFGSRFSWLALLIIIPIALAVYAIGVLFLSGAFYTGGDFIDLGANVIIGAFASLFYPWGILWASVFCTSLPEDKLYAVKFISAPIIFTLWVSLVIFIFRGAYFPGVVFQTVLLKLFCCVVAGMILQGRQN